MTNQHRFFKRPHWWVLISGLTLAVAALFMLAGFDTAHAAPTCTTSGQQMTCTFNFTGAPETWTVPDGVTQATFEVYGAQGGNILAASGFLVEGGGRGGKATATLTVQPGTTYQINVGGRGELRTFVPSSGGAGGFNGGASGSAGFDSTGGGGASDLRNGSFSLAGRVIVAGGGGGMGGSCGSIFGGNGGAGGGESGAAGFPSSAGPAEAVGGGGTQTAGGSGGAYLNSAPASELAQAGSIGFGGAGARLLSTVGGGGGGGYYGGGGGGISPGCPAAAGGGGGSGYGPTGVIFESGVRAGDGLVIITYTLDTTAPVILSTIDGVSGSNGWYVSAVTVNFTCVEEANGSGLATNTVAGATLTYDGANQSLTSTGECIDNAGNSATPVTVSNINIDKTPPVVTVDNVSDGATYTLGSVPISGCSTDDALSGVAIPAAFNRSGGNPDGTGSFTITCSGGTDNAGNSADPVSVSYTVTAGGTLVGVCGGYEVRQTGSSYTAAGWSGAIKIGTNGNNTLNGGSGPDLMLGLGGNDKLDGKGGDDIVCGGDGVDLIQGMAGNDYLDGGAGNDVLNGGSGDHDQLLAGEGNDTLLDGDGVSNAQGGAGNDLFTLALRKGWRDTNGQTQFAGRLAAGYGNDTVLLVILDRSPFFVDVTGDERDDPASPLEGNKDGLGLLGNLSPTPVRLKFEKQLVISAEAEGIVSEEAGAEYLTEPVGEDSSEEATLNNRIFLPLINR